MMWRKKPDINRILEEDIAQRRFAHRRQKWEKHRDVIARIEKEDLPKDAIVIPRKNVKSFLAGGLATILVLTFIGSAFAIFYAGNQQIISTVTTGTAPFSVASTTVVTNLNADLLDGYSASQLQDTPSGWTCTVREQASADCGSNCYATTSVACSGSEKVIIGSCCSNNAANCPGGGTWTDGTTTYLGPHKSEVSGQGWECQGYSSVGVVTASANCCS